MKTLIIIGFILNSFIVYAQQEIAEDSISNYLEKEVKVCSKVAGIFMPKGEKKNVFLNMGKPYPNSTFTIAIFEKNRENFSYNPEEYLKDKSICISGKVILYKGKPEIIATKEEQIEIIDK